MYELEFEKMLSEYSGKNPARFHMPGHKGTLNPNDITELNFSDNIHMPSGAIMSLERKCAKEYRADNAFLLVNGSSGGIIAFYLYVAMTLGRRPRILLCRDAHRSAVSASILSGADVLGVYPQELSMGMYTVNANNIKPALSYAKSCGTPIDAVCITSPNYYGLCVDLEGIANVARRHNALLFVDSAHGAHFGFSDMLPETPSKYADAWVVSTHKTLRSLNQTGLLFIRADSITRSKMQYALAMVQTTSPSYPLMASIENGIYRAASGEWDTHVKRIKALRNELTSQGVSLLSVTPAIEKRLDITRLCISAAGLAKSGFELGRMLTECGIYVEMSDFRYVVCITSPADDDEWYDRLKDALAYIKRQSSVFETAASVANAMPAQQDTYQFINMRNAAFSVTEPVALDSAEDKMTAAPVGIYPPGISLAFPGERITRDIIDVLVRCKEMGGVLFGVSDDLLIETTCVIM